MERKVGHIERATPAPSGMHLLEALDLYSQASFFFPSGSSAVWSHPTEECNEVTVEQCLGRGNGNSLTHMDLEDLTSRNTWTLEDFIRTRLEPRKGCMSTAHSRPLNGTSFCEKMRLRISI